MGSGLQLLCDVALRNEVDTVPVFDPKRKRNIFMNLSRYPCQERKGGKIRKIYHLNKKTSVKVYVLTCKQISAVNPDVNLCRECYRQSHHKCRAGIHVHVLRE